MEGRPHLRDFESSYTFPCCSPRICFRLLISAFDMICWCVASLTFSSLPLKGKTPYRSRPTTERPEMASALAESPSVRMRVQCCELRVPASLASSSLGMPVRRWHLEPSFFLSSGGGYIQI